MNSEIIYTNTTTNHTTYYFDQRNLKDIKYEIIQTTITPPIKEYLQGKKEYQSEDLFRELGITDLDAHDLYFEKLITKEEPPQSSFKTEDRFKISTDRYFSQREEIKRIQHQDRFKRFLDDKYWIHDPKRKTEEN